MATHRVKFGQTVSTQVGRERKTFEAGDEYSVDLREIAHVDPKSYQVLEKEDAANGEREKKKTTNVKPGEKRTTDLD